MHQTTIKNILIDFGGVLIDLDKMACVKSFEKLGLRDLDTVLNNTHQEGLFGQIEQGEIAEDEFHHNLRAFLKPGVTDQEIDEAWNRFLLTIPEYKLDLLLRLKKDYHVCLLSNTNKIHWDFTLKNIWSYKGHTIQDYFEQTFLSFEMKCAKPEPKIYEEVLKATGFKPEETLFIDDSALNLEVAATFGIQTYRAKLREDWSTLFYPKATV